jgi:hypothetical protein
MQAQNFNAILNKRVLEECRTILSAVCIALLSFVGTYSYDVFAANPEVETLTVTIEESVTFTVDTNSFGTLTPGVYKIATSTTNVSTNSAAWNMTLYGNNQGSGVSSTTLYHTTLGYATGIPDWPEWWASTVSTSTASVYPGVALASLGTNLAFRVMTASGSPIFWAPSWWGTDDGLTNARWAGIPSSTVQQKIGAVNAYTVANTINTVRYYLDVPSTQTGGAYTGDLTYTWVGGGV